MYHGLQVTAEKRYSKGLQFLVTYVWSKSIDDSSQADDNVTWLGSFTSLQDPNKPWLERSLSTFDIPNVLQVSYTYDLPFGRRRAMLGNMPRVLEAVMGGWKTNGVWRMSGGRPITLTVSDGNPLPTYGGRRAPTSLGIPSATTARTGSTIILSTRRFFAPRRFHARQRSASAGKHKDAVVWSSADMSLSKQFVIREEMNLEFRIEARNAFNHPVFGTPDTSLDDGSFGTINYTSESAPQCAVGGEVQLLGRAHK